MKKNYDFAWVPGLYGKKLMLDYGFKKKIYLQAYIVLLSMF